MSYSGLLQTTLTYWAPTSVDGFGGIGYAVPTTLTGRWQDEVDTFEDSDGQEFISSAIIYTTTELTENGWLYEGTSVATNPQTVTGAYRIRRLHKSQTPTGTIVVYKNVCG